MDRRRLLKLLALGVVGLELDIDRLLWVPGEKKFFIPTGNLAQEFNRLIDLQVQRNLTELLQLFERDYRFFTMINDGDSVGKDK